MRKYFSVWTWLIFRFTLYCAGQQKEERRKITLNRFHEKALPLCDVFSTIFWVCWSLLLTGLYMRAYQQ